MRSSNLSLFLVVACSLGLTACTGPEEITEHTIYLDVFGYVLYGHDGSGAEGADVLFGTSIFSHNNDLHRPPTKVATTDSEGFYRFRGLFTVLDYADAEIEGRFIKLIVRKFGYDSVETGIYLISEPQHVKTLYLYLD